MSDNQTKTVEVNCRVTIEGFEPGGEKKTYLIVDDSQANPQEDKLPVSSPLANALFGASVGERVPFNPPRGPVELTIVDVAPV